MIRTLVLIALLAAPLPAFAHDAPPLTSAEKAATDLALARGRLIYAYDQAAWHGTDAMLAKIKDPAKRIGGWIVDGPAAGPTLIFFDQDQSDPHAVYIAEFSGTRLVSDRIVAPDSPERMLSSERKAMIAARRKGLEAWREAQPLYCAKANPNTVVLPPERPGGAFLVYVMTPQTENGVYPFGGHYRVEIGADGQAANGRPFTKGCLSIPMSKDDNAVSAFITHLLDPVPTEIHVFTALSGKMPVMVGTGADRVWRVTGEAIEPSKVK